MKAKSLLRKFYKRYLLDAMSAMALGLFSSLIIGLILSQLSKLSFLSVLAPFGAVVSASSPVVGAAIGVAIAYGLKSAPLVMFSSAATGALGYSLGGPIGAYLAAVVGAELGGLVAGKTKVDIIVVPVVTIVTGGLLITWTAPGINWLIAGLQTFHRLRRKAKILQDSQLQRVIRLMVCADKHRHRFAGKRVHAQPERFRLDDHGVRLRRQFLRLRRLRQSLCGCAQAEHRHHQRKHRSFSNSFHHPSSLSSYRTMPGHGLLP